MLLESEVVQIIQSFLDDQKILAQALTDREFFQELSKQFNEANLTMLDILRNRGVSV